MPVLRYQEKTFPVPAGNLLEILRSEKALAEYTESIAAPCGGHGTCGKCRVGIRAPAGAVTAPGERELSLLRSVTAPLPEGYIWRLACRCEILAGTVDLWLPEKEGSLTGAQAVFSAREEGTAPWITWQQVSLARPTLADPVAVDENLRRQGIDMPMTDRAANRITALLTAAMDASPGKTEKIPLWIAHNGTQIADAGDSPVPLYAGAVDLGTTTVALSLWRDDGVRLGGTVLANPTRSCGADVISRISYAIDNEDGTERMARQMREAVDTALAGLAAEAGISPARISCRILAGNSVMEHLYAGRNPAPIGKVPFYSQSRFGGIMTGEPMTYLAPTAASYVGGDILMGAAWLLWDRPERREKTVLFLDLGTNGELGIYRDGKFIFAATAAGPAFEGAHITLGMPATPGAVTGIQKTEDGFALTAVDGKPPVGLCGSGILDGMGQMLELGLADAYGGLVDDREAWNTSLPDGLGVDAEGEQCTFAPGIYLTQGDVRQIQTARAAIAAGVEVLCRAAGVDAEQIEEVCLAGSFGHALDVRSAARVGLFPGILADRVSTVGNTSEAGCAAFWLYRAFREILDEVRRTSVYIELSAQPDFGELYMEKMCFEAE